VFFYGNNGTNTSNHREQETVRTCLLNLRMHNQKMTPLNNQMTLSSIPPNHMDINQ
jgi:hypothetical protein